MSLKVARTRTSTAEVAMGLALAVAASTALAQEREGCALARQAVLAQAAAQGWQAQVRCRDAAATPAGWRAVDSELGRAPALRTGPLAWPVRWQGPSGATQLRWEPLQVALRSQAWVMVRDGLPGDPVTAGDVALRWVDWGIGQQPVAPSDSPPEGRLLRRVHAGQALDPVAVASTDVRQRGDRVTLVLAQGPMELRLPARLVAPARVGQTARVQPEGRQDVIVGRLSGPHLVMGGDE